ncbi:hypothetical protein RF11_12931 [Thelohanellus kitauei]|uniref:Uncharacterized protein n=1 Tax=Thelohanellus kitauei TaxID=669202 RepID=A0A0C2JJ24_THEKT|nr:hypothetical protein RF11_12931 [Thelohanellus kitauei]
MYLLSLCYSELVVQYVSSILEKGAGLVFLHLVYYFALENKKKKSWGWDVKVKEFSESAVEQTRDELDKAMESYISSFENKRLGNINIIVESALHSTLKKPGESQRSVVDYITGHLENAVRRSSRQRDEGGRDRILSNGESVSTSSNNATAKPNVDSHLSSSNRSSPSGSIGAHGTDHLEIDKIQKTSKNGSKNETSDDGYRVSYYPQADFSSRYGNSGDASEPELPSMECL